MGGRVGGRRGGRRRTHPLRSRMKSAAPRSIRRRDAAGSSSARRRSIASTSASFDPLSSWLNHSRSARRSGRWRPTSAGASRPLSSLNASAASARSRMSRMGCLSFCVSALTAASEEDASSAIAPARVSVCERGGFARNSCARGETRGETRAALAPAPRSRARGSVARGEGREVRGPRLALSRGARVRWRRGALCLARQRASDGEFLNCSPPSRKLHSNEVGSRHSRLRVYLRFRMGKQSAGGRRV